MQAVIDGSPSGDGTRRSRGTHASGRPSGRARARREHPAARTTDAAADAAAGDPRPHRRAGRLRQDQPPRRLGGIRPAHIRVAPGRRVDRSTRRAVVCCMRVPCRDRCVHRSEGERARPVSGSGGRPDRCARRTARRPRPHPRRLREHRRTVRPRVAHAVRGPRAAHPRGGAVVAFAATAGRDPPAGGRRAGGAARCRPRVRPRRDDGVPRSWRRPRPQGRGPGHAVRADRGVAGGPVARVRCPSDSEGRSRVRPPIRCRPSGRRRLPRGAGAGRARGGRPAVRPAYLGPRHADRRPRRRGHRELRIGAHPRAARAREPPP